MYNVSLDKRVSKLKEENESVLDELVDKVEILESELDEANEKIDALEKEVKELRSDLSNEF